MLENDRKQILNFGLKKNHKVQPDTLKFIFSYEIENLMKFECIG